MQRQDLARYERPSPVAMARLLTMALAFAAASVPAFVGGWTPQGWCLALLSFGLAMRFPMAGLCAVLGSGAFVLVTLLGVFEPSVIGPPAIWSDDLFEQACAWLTLLASLLSLGLMDVPTFRHAFRMEGRPVATWRSMAGLPEDFARRES